MNLLEFSVLYSLLCQSSNMYEFNNLRTNDNKYDIHHNKLNNTKSYHHTENITSDSSRRIDTIINKLNN